MYTFTSSRRRSQPERSSPTPGPPSVTLRTVSGRAAACGRRRPPGWRLRPAAVAAHSDRGGRAAPGAIAESMLTTAPRLADAGQTVPSPCKWSAAASPPPLRGRRAERLPTPLGPLPLALSKLHAVSVNWQIRRSACGPPCRAAAELSSTESTSGAHSKPR